MTRTKATTVRDGPLRDGATAAAALSPFPASQLLQIWVRSATRRRQRLNDAFPGWRWSRDLDRSNNDGCFWICCSGRQIWFTQRRRYYAAAFSNRRLFLFS
ncbi:hypothetical protein HAX54_046106, partial [Datura stramonium]|nr:hypothetical protein [Datura stramonium]